MLFYLSPKIIVWCQTRSMCYRYIIHTHTCPSMTTVQVGNMVQTIFTILQTYAKLNQILILMKNSRQTCKLKNCATHFVSMSCLQPQHNMCTIADTHTLGELIASFRFIFGLAAPLTLPTSYQWSLAARCAKTTLLAECHKVSPAESCPADWEKKHKSGVLIPKHATLKDNKYLSGEKLKLLLGANFSNTNRGPVFLCWILVNKESFTFCLNAGSIITISFILGSKNPVNLTTTFWHCILTTVRVCVFKSNHKCWDFGNFCVKGRNVFKPSKITAVL